VDGVFGNNILPQGIDVIMVLRRAQFRPKWTPMAYVKIMNIFPKKFSIVLSVAICAIRSLPKIVHTMRQKNILVLNGTFVPPAKGKE
jgi:hypothetical protein